MSRSSRRPLTPWLTRVVLPLAVGCALYVVARPRGLWFWTWAEELGALGPLLAARAWLAPAACALPDWVRFTLPDALWVFALTGAVARLQRDSERRVLLAYLAVPLLLGPGAELAQLAGLLPGTFDVLDLVATVAAFGLALTPWPRPRRRAQPAAIVRR